MATRYFDEIDRVCARRMQDGTRKYGCLNLRNDPRNFPQEAIEELQDAINYIRWAWARGQIRQKLGERPWNKAEYLTNRIKHIIRMLETEKL